MMYEYMYVQITTIKEAVSLNKRAKWGYTNGGGKGKEESDAIILQPQKN